MRFSDQRRRAGTGLVKVVVVAAIGATSVIATIAPAGAATAPPTASFAGTVTAGGVPRPGVQVGLIEVGAMRVAAATTTSATGTYRFDGVRAGGSYRVLFVDPAAKAAPGTGLRPQFGPGVDILSKTLPVAGHLAASYPATAGTTTSVSAALVGWDCDPTVMKPGGSYVNRLLVMKDLTGCDLHGANFTIANLSATKLVGADLRGATLYGVTAYGADVRRARLGAAVVTGASWNNATFAASVGRPVGFEAATYANTACPTGVNSDANDATCAGQPW
jgi:hypothetical protein